MLRLCAVLFHRVSCLPAGLSLRLSVCHRHAVACFLTRGDLYLSWEAGAKVFDVWLLDSEWALNTCNWLWLSASAFFHTYFRCDHEALVAFGFRLSCLLFRLCRLRISGQVLCCAQSVLAGGLRAAPRPGGRLRAPLHPSPRQDAQEVHLRALEGAALGAEGGGVHRREGLSEADCGPRRGVQGQHRPHQRCVLPWLFQAPGSFSIPVS